MNPIDYAAMICYSSKDTLEKTRELALSQLKIEGDYVECGVAAGAQIIAMLDATNGSKNVYAFDSFEGIPLPSNRDNQMPGIRMLTAQEQKELPEPGAQVLETTGATSVSVGDFLTHVSNSGVNHEKLIVRKGWFEATMPVNDITSIALLRLDGDLYHSTFVCLKHLFHKVVNGGIVIIDDWQLPGCKAACDDFFKSIGYNPQYDIIHGVAYFTV